MSRGEDGLEHGWDRADAHEWTAPPARPVRSFQPAELMHEPELPAIRVWVVVVALALIVAGALIAIAGRVSGTVNGADLLGGILGVWGIVLVLREVRR